MRYENLNERDCRRYSGIEALKLGHSGKNYIAKVLGCSRKTVAKGAVEVSKLPMRAVQERIGKVLEKSPEMGKLGTRSI